MNIIPLDNEIKLNLHCKQKLTVSISIWYANYNLLLGFRPQEDRQD